MCNSLVEVSGSLLLDDDSAQGTLTTLLPGPSLIQGGEEVHGESGVVYFTTG